MTSEPRSYPTEMWVFGYGSLVYRPSFEHRSRQKGVVSGFARRFWQGSTDHRGVPGAPGRVVTLVRDEASTCAGMVYEIEAVQRDVVLAELDYREKGGYERLDLDVDLEDGTRVRALTYVAWPTNPNWLGEAPLADVAAQIERSMGPSGPNVEYLLRLHDALEAMGERDEHVTSLVQLVRGRR